MAGLEAVIPWLVAYALFMVLRSLERWLQQHLFKVGWLTTKDFQTTTIIYYMFFLPGLILNQTITWLAAGLFNVRTHTHIGWPESQEIAELRLNFVQPDANAALYRLTLIALVPLTVGLAAVWWIANSIFALPAVIQTLSPGTLAALRAGITQLLGATDFWLWYYLAFTIGNTMFPRRLGVLGGFRGLIVPGVVLAAIATIIGVGNIVVIGFLTGPVASILNTLSLIFSVIIGMNVFMVGVLAAIENTIERITGDSADFKDGKLIVMTRQERLDQQAKELQRQRQSRERRRAPASAQLSTGLSSLYALPLPLPGAPGEIPVTSLQQIMPNPAREERLVSALENRTRARTGTDLITTEKLPEDEERRLISGGNSPQLPPPSAPPEES
ncbi:MAG: hypothetical protein ACOYL5_10325 [Phototrophicaceae bacterium]